MGTDLLGCTMDAFGIGVIVLVLPVFALALHEATHLAVARVCSPVSVAVSSYTPLRLEIEFHDSPSRLAIRVVALAPVLFGTVAALVAYQTGIWYWVQHLDPYYLHYLLALNWVLYCCPSPADLRVAIHPPTSARVNPGYGS